MKVALEVERFLKALRRNVFRQNQKSFSDFLKNRFHPPGAWVSLNQEAGKKASTK